jgi:ATP-dependent RNA helicase DeaD
MCEESNREEIPELEEEVIVEELEKPLSFADFSLDKRILRAIEELGFKEPSPIQAMTIPVTLSGKDLIGQAQTGTGKTAAFGLPAIQMMPRAKGVWLLVLTPTRELCTQVANELNKYAAYSDCKAIAITGGKAYGKQIEALKGGGQMVVATPGRLLDLLRSGRFKDFAPSMLVLDEADEMLDMGFLEDIQEIFTHLPEDRQTLLFSATMPMPIQVLAKRFLKEPETIKVQQDDSRATLSNIVERYYVIDERERDDAVMRLMENESPEKSIVFCRTKAEVDRLTSTLISRNFLAKGLHGDMEQAQRQEVMGSMHDGKIKVLVATDVAARGLDIQDLTHVFNYHIPFNADSYLHRIGRTGRAGHAGVAVTLVTPAEFRTLRHIKSRLNSNMMNANIPTKTEMRESIMGRLVQVLGEQEVHPDVHDYLGILMKEFGMKLATHKLMSYLLSQHAVEGAEKIGLSAARLKAFHDDLKNNFSRKGKGGRSGKSGNGKSGSSGRHDRMGFKKRQKKSPKK